MADYLTYEVEDFVVDDFFIAWVLDEDRYAKCFWEKWMEEHPHQKPVIMHAYSIVKGIQVTPHGYLSDVEIEEIHEKVIKRIAQSGGYSGFRYLFMTSRRWLSLAALVMLVLTAGTIVYFKRESLNPAGLSKPAEVAFVLRQNRGVHPVLVRLPDHSSVVLKPGSTLRYRSSFDDKNREVELKGEAFFEVKHKMGHPFIVHTGEMSTLVLGTSFKVRAFVGEPDFRVVVTSGKVSVYRVNSKNVQRGSIEKAITVVANEALVYDRRDTSFIKQRLNKPLVLSPEVARRIFRFHNVPFGKVIQKLKDVYGVEIIFDKNTFGKCSISASLSNQSLYEKVKLICEAVNAQFIVNESNITIEGKGCNENYMKDNVNP